MNTTKLKRKRQDVENDAHPYGAQPDGNKYLSAQPPAHLAPRGRGLGSLAALADEQLLVVLGSCSPEAVHTPNTHTVTALDRVGASPLTQI